MAMRTAMVIALVVSSMLGATSIEPRAASADAGNSIKVIVVGLHSNHGEVDCALFNSADGFPDDSSKAIKTVESKIENQQAVCIFEDVIPGDYAVSEFHDENANGKLDRNFIGMPKEGVGASNDAAGHMGPPKFEDARFKFNGGLAVMTIHTRYLLAPL
jgi:uncharacterized protein (DUF2141 family)